MSHAASSTALEAVRERAMQLGANMVATIVDHAGELHAFQRMDGAPLASVTLATDKAYTAAALGNDTSELGQLLYSDSALENGFRAFRRVLAFQGGYPIYLEGDLAGGIAVGGSRASNDEAAAQAAIDAIRMVPRALPRTGTNGEGGRSDAPRRSIPHP